LSWIRRALRKRVNELIQFMDQDGNNTLTFQKCINGLVVMRRYAFENECGKTTTKFLVNLDRSMTRGVAFIIADKARSRGNGW
jgi:hypothetical protein